MIDMGIGVCKIFLVVYNGKGVFLDVQNIEKYIAIKTDRLKKHEIKWDGF